jgi:hypothetical protein
VTLESVSEINITCANLDSKKSELRPLIKFIAAAIRVHCITDTTMYHQPSQLKLIKPRTERGLPFKLEK